MRHFSHSIPQESQHPRSAVPDVNPAEVYVVLPHPEAHGEHGRLGLRPLLLVRDGVTPQVGPPPPVARLKESNAEKMRHDSDMFALSRKSR